MSDDNLKTIAEVLDELDVPLGDIISKGTLLACASSLALYSYEDRYWLFGTKLEDNKVSVYDSGAESKIEKFHAFGDNVPERIGIDILDEIEKRVIDDSMFLPDEMIYSDEKRTLYVSTDIGHEDEKQVVQLGLKFKERGNMS